MRAPAAVLVLWLGLGVSACRVDSAGSPAFSLPDLDGNLVSLAELRGRPVVLDFWATWCGPCIAQIPILNSFHAAHPDDVVVLGISVDVAGPDVVAAFAEEHGIEYPVLLGDEALAQSFGAIGFPTLYVIAPDGTVDSAHVGVITEAALEESVAAVR